MNPRLDRLHPYPFERLSALLAGTNPPVDLSPIKLDGLAAYPATKGTPDATPVPSAIG
jgi:N-succinyldiaminopimelate aminotransferase